ncbi:MAG: hypothetical protein R3182_08185, partial [Draconibacterium sp.]|nr:hypothetical protein [Draconibacterium sp.]
MLLHTKYYQLDYEKAAVRWIKSGSTEIVRMIYSAVRDHNWGTVEPKILDEEISKSENGFHVKTLVQYQQNNIHFQSEYQIIGHSKKLELVMKGKALSTFQTCRVGFCVLHPINECASNECTILHPDGSNERAIFPEFISPHQPMMNIAGMEWQPSESISAKLKFEGDIFEMEDQRNWTDASYKTYCRPLDKSFPFEVKKGEKINQKIVLEVEGDECSIIEKDETIIFKIDKNRTFQIPELGVCNTNRYDVITSSEAEVLKDLPFSHLRAELRLSEKAWKLNLARIVAESNQLDLPLFLVLYFSKNWENEWRDLVKAFQNIPVQVNHILIVGKNHLPDDEVLKNIRPKLKKLFPNAKIGNGVNAYFAELNRNRPKTELADFISFTISPQVHAFDNASLVENLEAQKHTVKSAKKYFPGKPIFVSPITLKQRFNVVAT